MSPIVAATADAASSVPLWWWVEPVDDSESKSQVGGMGWPCDERVAAAMDPTAEALLQLFRGQDVEDSAARSALSVLDPESVVCTLEAMDKHLNSCPVVPPKTMLSTSQDCLVQIVSRVMQEVQQTNVSAGARVNSPSKDEVQLGDAKPDAEQQTFPHLPIDLARRAAAQQTHERWRKALGEASTWKEQQLSLLRDAGSAASSACSQLAALDPFTLSAASLFLEGRQFEEGGSLVKATPVARSYVPLWWVAHERDSTESGEERGGKSEDMSSGTRTVVDTEDSDRVLALLGLFRGESAVADQQKEVIAGLCADTVRCVLEAVERHMGWLSPMDASLSGHAGVPATLDGLGRIARQMANVVESLQDGDDLPGFLPYDSSVSVLTSGGYRKA